VKKTQFTDLIKIQKMKVEKIEREISKEQGHITLFENRASEIEGEILEIQYPTMGTFSAFQQMNMAMHNMKGDVKRLQDGKRETQNRIATLQQKLKKEQMELEKFLYLEQDVLKKVAEKKKVAERNYTDEVAILLTNVKKRKSEN
jgi:flagellar biosynthesis chaperone FliJ